MKVLAVIPVHDREEFLCEALNSVLAQTRHADEVVVTGNVASWAAAGRAIRFGGRLAFEYTRDPLAARVNRAVESSNCEAFFLLCDDDLVQPSFLAETSAAMVRAGADVAYTDYERFGLESLAVETGPVDNWIRESNPLPVTALVRCSAWKRAGGYQDVDHFDWDLWKRMHAAGARFVKVPGALFGYRVHGGQASRRVEVTG